MNPLEPLGETQAAAPTPERLTESVGAITRWATDSPSEPSNETEQVSIPGFEVLKEIGRGGMGVVYLARELTLNRTVALKMILNTSYASPDSLIRFLNEAEAIARVEHPHIVRIYQSGKHQITPYFALEYIDGGTLQDRIRDHPLEPREAASLMQRIAEAIGFCHSRGLIHRDLKPMNVLMTAAGIPKVSDFGLSKRLDIGDGLTATGQILGTPSYMPPEQARGETDRLDERADVYSLGAILYAMLTGRPPFTAPSALTILSEVISSDPIPPCLLQPGIPHDLETICLKCLRKEPTHRYATANELAADLARCQKGEPILARPVGAFERGIKWIKRHPVRMTFAMVFLLILLAFVVVDASQSQRLRESRVLNLLQRLETSPLADLPRIRDELEPLRNLAREPLNQLRQRLAPQSTGSFAVALLRVNDDPEEIPFLVERIAERTPEELLVIRTLLNRHREAFQDRLREVVLDRESPRAARLRAFAVLAEWDRSLSPEISEELVAQMLSEDPTQLPAWIRSLDSAREGFIAPLERQYLQNADVETGLRAALVLREYLRGEVPRVISLLVGGSNRQAYLLSAAIRENPEAIAALDAEWNRFDPLLPNRELGATSDNQFEGDARRRTKIALAMLTLRHLQPIWRICSERLDPRVRSELIEAMSEAAIDPRLLEAGLEQSDPQIRYSIYLAWSEFPRDRWSAAESDRLIERIRRDYFEHVDPGVHAAARHLLRKWNALPDEKERNSRLPQLANRGTRNWYIGDSGVCFTIIPGPITTRIGSSITEAGQPTGATNHGERITFHRIDRSYAIAQTEVTFQEYQRFLKETPDRVRPDKSHGLNWASRTNDSPAIDLRWYEAVSYCRWLSEKEKIPESEMCYPPLDEIKPGMKVPVDYLQRTGYRLPTAAEWEYACRAESRTRFHFGSDDRLMRAYAWYDRNSDLRTHPCGFRKPNPWGLFDMHGNSFEWCGLRSMVKPLEFDVVRPVNEDQGDDLPCNNSELVEARGGDFPAVADRLRSSHRTNISRELAWPGSGFRLARTIVPSTFDVYRIEGEDRHARFALRGKPGAYRIVEVTPGVRVSATEGKIPSEMEVISELSGFHEYLIVLERTDTGERQTVRDTFIPIEWDMTWIRWAPKVDRGIEMPDDQHWDEMCKSPLHREKTRKIGYLVHNVNPRPNVPFDYFGRIAEATVELPAGKYSLEAASDDGYRVFLNGEWQLEHNWSRGLHRQLVHVTLPAGKHRIRIESYQIYGPAFFDFELRKLE